MSEKENADLHKIFNNNKTYKTKSKLHTWNVSSKASKLWRIEIYTEQLPLGSHPKNA